MLSHRDLHSQLNWPANFKFYLFFEWVANKNNIRYLEKEGLFSCPR